MHGKVRYGVIGCGVIAAWHAKALALKNDVGLVAVCDLNIDAAKRVSEEFGGKPFDDIGEMLAKESLDAVSICTPGGTHCDITVQVAEAGVHALCEKPIEVKRDKLDKMIDACRENDVILGGVFQMRTFPLWNIIRDIVSLGKLGRIILADAYLKYYRSPEYYKAASWRGTYALDGGACLMNQGIHCVDLLQWIAGPVKRVTGFADHLVRDIEAEDTAVSILEFESGAFGVIEGATSSYPGTKARLEFHGEFGTLRTEGSKIVELNSSLIGDSEKNIILDNAVAAESNSSQDPKAFGIEGHVNQIHDFVDAVRELREPMVTGEDARKAVDIILSIYESARTGKPVNVSSE